MDHFREIKNSLKWHNEGKFEVELINGIIPNLIFVNRAKALKIRERALHQLILNFYKLSTSALATCLILLKRKTKNWVTVMHKRFKLCRTGKMKRQKIRIQCLLKLNSDH